MPGAPPRGRFAPSPTGPLHFGSLVAAVGSYLAARSRGAEWLVRIEDVDVPRTVPGAADDILRTLDAFGLHWDGSVVHQSERTALYDEALEALREKRLVYGCACTRREVGGSPYPGTCRNGPRGGRRPRSLRVRTHARPVGFDDLVQGRFEQLLERDVGDFVVRRADGLHAYHLAVVIDDAAQGVHEVVRGADLLDSTPRQIHLQVLLDLPTPVYAHLPVAVNADGQKLSKQSHAPRVDASRPGPALARAMAFLGHAPPVDLAGGDTGDLIAWGVSHFKLSAVPRCTELPAPLS